MDETKHRSGVAAFVRAPLIHFLVLGGLLFAGYTLFSPGVTTAYREPKRTITVSAERIAALAEGWLGKRQRPPTDAELAAYLDANRRSTGARRGSVSDRCSSARTAAGMRVRTRKGRSRSSGTIRRRTPIRSVTPSCFPPR